MRDALLSTKTSLRFCYNKTRGRVRVGPSSQLGTLSTRVANLLCMTLVKAMTSGFPNALVFCCSSALRKPDIDLFTARTDRHDLPPTNQPAKVTVPSRKLGTSWYYPAICQYNGISYRALLSWDYSRHGASLFTSSGQTLQSSVTLERKLKPIMASKLNNVQALLPPKQTLDPNQFQCRLNSTVYKDLVSCFSHFDGSGNSVYTIMLRTITANLTIFYLNFSHTNSPESICRLHTAHSLSVFVCGPIKPCSLAISLSIFAESS